MLRQLPPVARYVLLAAAITAVILAGRRFAGIIPEFAAWVQNQGPTGAILFVVGYVIATVAFVPGSLLTLAAGAIYGLGRGTVLVFIAATVGASAAFLISRYLARGAVERRLAGHAKFSAIDRAVGREGRRIVFLLRLSPLFPFNLLNYALGLTRVRFLDFVVASVGMVPGTLLYVYYGKVIADVARLAAGAPASRGWGYYLVLALGLVATIAVAIVVSRIARRALLEATEADLDPA